jgi:hypothetical protein
MMTSSAGRYSLFSTMVVQIPRFHASQSLGPPPLDYYLPFMPRAVIARRILFVLLQRREMDHAASFAASSRHLQRRSELSDKK